MNENEVKFASLKSGHLTVTVNVQDTLSRHLEFSSILLANVTENLITMKK